MSTSFPKWAPAILIEAYKRLLAEADDYRKKASGEYEYSLSADDPDQEFEVPNYEEKINQLDELITVLYRLLTHPDMNSVWAIAVSRPPANPKPWKKEPALFLWTTISRALTDFPIPMADARTGSEMRKSLLSIASKAKALQDSIGENVVAETHANELVAAYLTRTNIKYRQDEGERLHPYEFATSVTLSCDCTEASRKYYLSGYKSWDKEPLVCRLA